MPGWYSRFAAAGRDLVAVKTRIDIDCQPALKLPNSRIHAQRSALAAAGDNNQIVPIVLKERTHDR